MHIAGRQWHYVYGVAATEEDGAFELRKIPRKCQNIGATG
jgi:hypothetical protein